MATALLALAAIALLGRALAWRERRRAAEQAAREEGAFELVSIYGGHPDCLVKVYRNR